MYGTIIAVFALGLQSVGSQQPPGRSPSSTVSETSSQSISRLVFGKILPMSVSGYFSQSGNAPSTLLSLSSESFVVVVVLLVVVKVELSPVVVSCVVSSS